VSTAFSVLTALAELGTEHLSLNLNRGIATAMTPKLESARRCVEREDLGPAENILKAFMNQVNALRGKKIPKRQADSLIGQTREILTEFE